MKLRLRIFSLLGALILPLSAATAQSLNAVQIRVLDENSQVIKGVPVEATSGGTVLDFAETNTLGIANFFTLTEGEYSFAVLPSQAYQCDSCAVYKDTEKTVTVVRSGDSYTSGTDIFSAGDKQLEKVLMNHRPSCTAASKTPLLSVVP